MTSFSAAFEHIIAIEKFYTNQRNDRGGPTKYGITQRTLCVYYKRPVTIEEVQDLTIFQARLVYEKLFWKALKLDRMPSTLALALFDQVVNRGASAAVMSLQAALKIREDGILGPITHNLALTTNQDTLIWNFLKESQIAYCRIVQRNPSQVEFIAGWSNRILALVEKTLLVGSLRGSSSDPSLSEEFPSPIV